MNQVALLLRFSVKLRQFEQTEFAFKQQLARSSDKDVALIKGLHRQLPHIKIVQTMEVAIFIVVGTALFTNLNQPFMGIIYELLSLLTLAVLSRSKSIQILSKKVFMSTLSPMLKVIDTLKPLWFLLEVAKRREPLIPGTKAEFTDLLQRLPSTVLQPIERQRMESILEAEAKTVKDIMTPKKRVITVGPSATLGPIVLSDLQKSGHGYFPVATKKGEPEGILQLGDVGNIEIAKQRSSVSEQMSSHVVWVEEETSLVELTQAFLQEKQYMVLVRNLEGEFSGIVTIADLMRNLVGIIKERTP